MSRADERLHTSPEVRRRNQSGEISQLSYYPVAALWPTYVGTKLVTDKKQDVSDAHSKYGFMTLKNKEN